MRLAVPSGTGSRRNLAAKGQQSLGHGADGSVSAYDNDGPGGVVNGTRQEISRGGSKEGANGISIGAQTRFQPPGNGLAFAPAGDGICENVDRFVVHQYR